jgi:hypothetical protein
MDTSTSQMGPSLDGRATESSVTALLTKRPWWRSFVDGEFLQRPGAGTFAVLEAATGETLVRAKNVRFPSGRGEVPGWPPGPLAASSVTPSALRS